MSSIRDLKKALRSSMNMEEELYEFCVDAVKHIYKDDEAKQRYAVARFEEGVDFFDYNGCIQGLSCLISVVEKDKSPSKE